MSRFLSVWSVDRRTHPHIPGTVNDTFGHTLGTLRNLRLLDPNSGSSRPLVIPNPQGHSTTRTSDRDRFDHYREDNDTNHSDNDWSSHVY